jgi:hypothetical protein
VEEHRNDHVHEGPQTHLGIGQALGHPEQLLDGVLEGDGFHVVGIFHESPL